MPLTLMLLLRAAIPHLGAELALLDDLTDCKNFQFEMNGIRGYCYTTLKVSYRICIFWLRQVNVWRQEFVDKDKLTTENRKKTLTANIPQYTTPGITADTRFSFKEEGDRFPTKIPSDIKFIVEDQPHHVFKRRNLYNIAYVHETSETLDARKIKASLSDVVTPD
uniref:DnaJ_C domain-containing protein n=1 Tax=Glossina pallidipes TaxID=7398 RepID=A0A1A9ZGV2_GLOPL